MYVAAGAAFSKPACQIEPPSATAAFSAAGCPRYRETTYVAMSNVVRASQLFLPTLKDAPADAVASSHQLLVRAGFIRQLGAGLYTSLPLGRRSLRKLEHILRGEMEAIGAQEFLLPSLHPAELWRASGRWDAIDDTMFRLTDRRGGDYCLAMTHEEVFTALAAAGLRSYRQLPQIWYQIGLKFRDEPRPKAGLLRVREFQMKDAYSFDLAADGLDRSFERVRGAYERIFARCELQALPAEAFSGAMGGRESIEFVLATDVGEDRVVRCDTCDYVANVEIARSRPEPVLGDTDADHGPDTLECFATPGVLTIDALASAPYGVPPSRQLKTLVYIADNAPVVAVLRGNHTLNESKLQVATGAARVRPAQADEILRVMGAHAGSLGGVDFRRAPVLVDDALDGRAGMVTGANRDGFHLRGVDVARDILDASRDALTGSQARLADLRTVLDGDGCPGCTGTLASFAALEIGHIFKFGSRYSIPLSATVLDAEGEDVPLMMGSYGIGLGRLLAAVVEQHHDEHGIVWPMSLAPFGATVLTLGVDPELEPIAEAVAADLAAAGCDVLYDDREERAGVKLNDADLIGIPLRITVSRRGLADNTVEYKLRAQPTSQRIPSNEVGARFRQLRA
jgi:prolyl-tRNA synthetase